MITDENSKSHPSFPLTLHGVVAPAADSILSDLHLALHAAIMPLHANMLGICPTGHPEAWTLQRPLSGHLAHSAMQSLGRLRL